MLLREEPTSGSPWSKVLAPDGGSPPAWLCHGLVVRGKPPGLRPMAANLSVEPGLLASFGSYRNREGPKERFMLEPSLSRPPLNFLSTIRFRSCLTRFVYMCVGLTKHTTDSCAFLFEGFERSRGEAKTQDLLQWERVLRPEGSQEKVEDWGHVVD